MANDEGENKVYQQYDPFVYNQLDMNRTILQQQPSLDPAFMSFTNFIDTSLEYNSVWRPLDVSCSSSELISPVDDMSKKKASNASVSSSSDEAAPAAEDDSVKSKKEEKRKKQNAAQKKEKREREPRFAFLTKSEIDQLEDGYRWRKYGQKAVKNSPYPRSYYRCTSQKCVVKKRVERSYQDPSLVITTYEGQHIHHCPATLRGHSSPFYASASTSTLATAPSSGPALPQELFSHLLSKNCQTDPTSMVYQNPNLQQHLQMSDHHSLLQDLFTQK
ncbi:probable WRKY transcription factor 71 [Cucurbita pepo subsp. pepo]|uniref:probable WRKY transcription factor 71 n=1 Tax=Cucurbita pepo subsp. pepo TaxID=3664 RepID=UPI000C9D5D0C|nr:probable WRKY transcription factor 71 [Cucurbita pepo subsp. pepo]